MINYIKANPLRLAIKRTKPGLFAMVRDLKVSVMLSPETEPVDQRVLHVTAIGNRSLLKRPMEQVQCSRDTSTTSVFQSPADD